MKAVERIGWFTLFRIDVEEAGINDGNAVGVGDDLRGVLNWNQTGIL
jgi:hypothetical protein